MKTGKINHEHLLQCPPGSKYVDPTNVLYISHHQPLWYDHMTQVDNIDNPVPLTSCNAMQHTIIKH